MIPIPVPVTQVSIYPYIPQAPIRVLPVLVNGAGTYSVGTLTTNIFYNLDLTSGTQENGGVHAGLKYYAVFKDANGNETTTTWMTCLQGGPAPRFGRTISMLGNTSNDGGNDASPDIAYQIHLSGIDVDMAVPPTEPLLVPLIRDGNGIATFAGLLPGGTWSVAVSGGDRTNPLRNGMRVTVRGINIATGTPFAIPGTLITSDAGDPAEFVQYNGPQAG